MNNLLKFKQLYYEVFDTNGNMKACGRKKCIELIETANLISTNNYGDISTGFININNIQQLYNTI